MLNHSDYCNKLITCPCGRKYTLEDTQLSTVFVQETKEGTGIVAICPSCYEQTRLSLKELRELEDI